MNRHVGAGKVLHISGYRKVICMLCVVSTLKLASFRCVGSRVCTENLTGVLKVELVLQTGPSLQEKAVFPA